MKKRFVCLLLAVLVMSALCIGAFAEPQLNNVTDSANILTDEQRNELEKECADIAARYGIGVYIVTIEDYTEICDDVYEATYSIYHQYTMGEGEDRDGMMLLLSMEGRKYATFCYGEKGEAAFTKSGIEMLEEDFLDDFKDDDWYEGFEDYVEDCASYIEKAADGHPVKKFPIGDELIVVGVSLVLAGIVVGRMVAKMKDVHKAVEASEYVSGSLNLTENSDVFTHRTETRVLEVDDDDDDSSCSGGGGHGSSGDF